jgi:protein FAM32A
MFILPATIQSRYLTQTRKKKKSKHKEGLGELQHEHQKSEKASSKGEDRSAPNSGRNSPAVVGSSSNGGPQKTEAEKRFEERQRQRV